MNVNGRRTSLAIATTALVLIAAACGGSNDTAPLTAATLEAVPGSNAQVGTVGQALAAPIAVQVLAANGSPVAGVLVTWAIQSGGGSTSVATTKTDADGTATVAWTLGTIAGTDSLIASVDGATAIALFATANAGPAVALVKVSGDQQTVAAGSASQPLVVKAVDAYGNAVAGVTVAWIPENGGVLGAQTSVTGSDGTTQDALTADTATTYLVMAELQSDATIEATFTEVVD